MKILWISNAPWSGSGYGTQTALFARRLAALGHDVAVACNFGLNGATFEYHGLTCYPSDGNYQNSAIATYVEAHEADVAILLCDAWVMHPEKWPADVRAAIWAPVDHYPIPPGVFAVLDHEQVFPIAMSRFGSEQMQQVALEHAYVPHGVDTDLFAPRPETRDAIRAELGIPRDAFLVGMIAANKGNAAMPRKAFPQAFLAFAGFAQDHDDAYLYVHAESIPSGTGINLERCSIMAGVPQNRIHFPDPRVFHLGLSDEVMSNLYQAFDVMLLASSGEGFGIPLIEAQACGVPVITSKHSAMRELCGAGWLTDGQPLWDALSDAWFFDPFVHSIRANLNAAYDAAGDRELSAKAAAFAAQYDASRVALEHWVPALEQIAALPPLETEAREPGAQAPLPAESRQVRRARERAARKTAGKAA